MLIEAPFNRVTGDVIAAAIEVHKVLGPGLLESTYIECLQYELSARKMRFVTQRRLPLVYKGIALGSSFRLDLAVEDVAVIEVKSVATLEPVHDAQLLTYLNLSGHPVGLLINFNVAKLVDGVRRIINRSRRPIDGRSVRLRAPRVSVLSRVLRQLRYLPCRRQLDWKYNQGLRLAQSERTPHYADSELTDANARLVTHNQKLKAQD